MDIDARAFGQLEGQVTALAKTLAEQNLALAAMKLQLEEMAHTLSAARGGWRTLLWLGGASASLAAAVTWVLQHLAFKSP